MKNTLKVNTWITWGLGGVLVAAVERVGERGCACQVIKRNDAVSSIP